MNKGFHGAPLGIAHGKATVEFDVIEKIRREKLSGATVKQLARKYDKPIDTIRDWVYYRTRILK